jgi:hypothetical protein
MIVVTGREQDLAAGWPAEHGQPVGRPTPLVTTPIASRQPVSGRGVERTRPRPGPGHRPARPGAGRAGLRRDPGVAVIPVLFDLLVDSRQPPEYTPGR